VDSCGLINVFEYQTQLPKVSKILQKDPVLFSRLNSVLAQLMYLLGNDPVKYKKLIQALVNYSYNHNICPGSQKYLILSYMVYVLYEQYLALHHKSSVEKLLDFITNSR
jgi:hypothetical protein